MHQDYTIYYTMLPSKVQVPVEPQKKQDDVCESFLSGVCAKISRVCELFGGKNRRHPDFAGLAGWVTPHPSRVASSEISQIFPLKMLIFFE